MNNRRWGRRVTYRPSEDETPLSEDPEERLRRLRELYGQRLITEEEYEAKRREILGEL